MNRRDDQQPRESAIVPRLLWNGIAFRDYFVICSPYTGCTYETTGCLSC